MRPTWRPTSPTRAAARARIKEHSPRPAWRDAKTGEQIFTAAGCASCHTFQPAGSQANIGPNLDELAAAAGDREPGKSAEDYVREAILQPDAFTVEGFNQGAMPSYEGRLTDAQVDALTEYLLNP